eukprot:2237580-Pleurochrysis_carterae.AAC.2
MKDLGACRGWTTSASGSDAPPTLPGKGRPARPRSGRTPVWDLSCRAVRCDATIEESSSNHYHCFNGPASVLLSYSLNFAALTMVSAVVHSMAFCDPLDARSGLSDLPAFLGSVLGGVNVRQSYKHSPDHCGSLHAMV